MKTNSITKYLIGLLFVVVIFLSYMSIRLEKQMKEMDVKYGLQIDSLKHDINYVDSRVDDNESKISEVDNENDDLDSRISEIEENY